MANAKDEKIRVRVDIQASGTLTVEMTREDYEALCNRIDADGPVDVGETILDVDNVLNHVDMVVTDIEEA